jgi:hypothetical protein
VRVSSHRGGGGDANDSGLSAVRGSGVDGRWGKEGGVAHVAVSKRERWKKREDMGAVADTF